MNHGRSCYLTWMRGTISRAATSLPSQPEAAVGRQKYRSRQLRMSRFASNLARPERKLKHTLVCVADLRISRRYGRQGAGHFSRNASAGIGRAATSLTHHQLAIVEWQFVANQETASDVSGVRLTEITPNSRLGAWKNIRGKELQLPSPSTLSGPRLGFPLFLGRV